MLYQGIIGGGSSPVEPVDLSPVLLWTNPSPTNEFAAQTVSLDLAKYAGVIVEYKEGTAVNNIVSRIYCKRNESTKFASGYLHNSSARARTLSMNDTGVTFGDTYVETAKSNGNLVPVKIYGVKEYVVEPFKPIDATVCERAYTFPATSGTTNTWTVVEDGLYFLTGDAPGISDSRGSISLIGDITLISGSEPVRVFKAKAGAQVDLIVSSGNSFTPYINRIK